MVGLTKFDSLLFQFLSLTGFPPEINKRKINCNEVATKTNKKLRQINSE